jgi:hypothetical protein
MKRTLPHTTQCASSSFVSSGVKKRGEKKKWFHPNSLHTIKYAAPEEKEREREKKVATMTVDIQILTECLRSMLLL